MDSKVALNSHKQTMYKIIEEYQQSGKTQKIFCQDKDIPFSTLVYRLKKYRKERSKPNRFIPLNVVNEKYLWRLSY